MKSLAIVLLLASSAVAQLSVQEAQERLRQRQALKPPTTQPTVEELQRENRQLKQELAELKSELAKLKAATPVAPVAAAATAPAVQNFDDWKTHVIGMSVNDAYKSLYATVPKGGLAPNKPILISASAAGEIWRIPIDRHISVLFEVRDSKITSFSLEHL